MVKYWIKPVGTTDASNNATVQPGQTFDKTTIINFSKKRPTSIDVGDILIVYAIGDGRIISYFETTSLPKMAYSSDSFWQDWMERWPWYIEVNNLTPVFGKEWWKYHLYFKKLMEFFIRINPKGAVSINGSQTLGTLNYGNDKAQIDEKFANFIIEKIDFAIGTVKK